MDSLAKIVLISSDDEFSADNVAGELKVLGHDIVKVSIEGIAGIKKDKYSLVVLFLSSKKNISGAVSTVRAKHMLGYMPFIIIDQGDVFSGLNDRKMMDFFKIWRSYN